jgi:hypothetical protein
MMDPGMDSSANIGPTCRLNVRSTKPLSIRLYKTAHVPGFEEAIRKTKIAVNVVRIISGTLSDI